MILGEYTDKKRPNCSKTKNLMAKCIDAKKHRYRTNICRKYKQSGEQAAPREASKIEVSCVSFRYMAAQQRAYIKSIQHSSHLKK